MQLRAGRLPSVVFWLALALVAIFGFRCPTPDGSKYISMSSPSPENHLRAPPSRAAPISCLSFFNSKIQLTKSQVAEIDAALRSVERIKKPNFLVFGLGFDTDMWDKCNPNGNTVYVENMKDWISESLAQSPHLNIIEYHYKTSMDRWKDLLDADKELAARAPQELKDVTWDVILVDSPMGWGGPDNPGRMTPIAWATNFVAPRGHVFVHDVDREIEAVFSRRWVRDKLGFTEKRVGTLAHLHGKGDAT